MPDVPQARTCRRKPSRCRGVARRQLSPPAARVPKLLPPVDDIPKCPESERAPDYRDNVRPKDQRRPGRPRNEDPSVVVHLRLPAHLYDAYARHAISVDRSVYAVLREVLERHRPDADTPSG